MCIQHTTSSIADRIHAPINIKHEALMVLSEINNTYSNEIKRNLGLQLIV